KLIEVIAEYKAAMDWRVIIVFDAHLVPGVEQSYIENSVEVIYTRKNETADERIEKMTRELKHTNVQIH
ncbi:NYN domain-containing protein, partial [Bacillus velezensis]|uniref:NYN domain-containing protein n=1 Tax=Bacillus velezensis TaxID=492670 RepID=UPI0020BF6807